MWYDNQATRDKCNILSILRQYLGRDTIITHNQYTSPYLYINLLNIIIQLNINIKQIHLEQYAKIKEISSISRKRKFEYRYTDNLLILRWRDVWMLLNHESKIEASRRNYLTRSPNLKESVVDQHQDSFCGPC